MRSLALEPGDAVIVHTGWGRLWTEDIDRYSNMGPGIGVEAAEWLAGQDPMLVGADTVPVEILPNPDPAISLPVHQIMLVVNGIHLVERNEAGRTGGERCLRVRVHRATVEDSGSDGFHCRSGRRLLNRSKTIPEQCAERSRNDRERGDWQPAG